VSGQTPFWSFVETLLEIDPETTIVDARQSIVGQIPIGKPVRIEKARPDTHYHFLIVDGKGLQKCKSEIASLTFDNLVVLSEGTKNDEALNFMTFVDAHFESVPDISMYLPDCTIEKNCPYKWLFACRITAKKEEAMSLEPETVPVSQPNLEDSSNELMPSPSGDAVVDHTIEGFGAVNLDGLYDFEKPIVSQICEHINEHVKRTLEWYWKLGKLVYKLKREEDKHNCSFHERLEVLRQMLDNRTIRTLLNAKMIYERWSNLEEFKKVISYNESPERQGMLSFRHLLALARIDDDEKVDELAQAVVTKGIAAQELEAILIGKTGKRRGPGRGVNVPESIEERLYKLNRHAAAFRKVLEALYAGGKFASDLEQLNVDDEIELVIVNAIDALEDISSMAQVLLQTFDKMTRSKDRD